MSEEVIVAGEIHTGVFYTIKAEDTMILLDKDRARELRDELNQYLGDAKVHGQNMIGIVFPRGVPEPIGLPVGTRLKDNEGDIAERVDDGWAWVELFGDLVDRPESFTWAEITDSDSHKEFTVIA